MQNYAAFCIIFNRIPLEQNSLWDFPMIRFHYEYKLFSREGEKVIKDFYL